jgi:uncharacterized membrane protein
MEKFLRILKRIVGTLMLPVLMYVVMLILTHANGKTYFGTLDMWKTLILDIAVSVTCAMGIGLQFRVADLIFQVVPNYACGRYYSRKYCNCKTRIVRFY